MNRQVSGSRRRRRVRLLAGTAGLVIAAVSATVVAAGSMSNGAPALGAEPAQPPGAAASPASIEELGKLLFFERRLSGDASLSCATCHAPEKAWADGLPLSRGYRSTLYFRNTPSVLNAVRMPVLDWDGRFAQGDTTSLIRDHLAEAHFMNIDRRLLVERLRQVPEYEDAFTTLLGGEVSYGGVLNAIAAFIEDPDLEGSSLPPLPRRCGGRSLGARAERASSFSRARQAAPSATPVDCCPTASSTCWGCPKTRRYSRSPSATSPSGASSGASASANTPPNARTPATTPSPG